MAMATIVSPNRVELEKEDYIQLTKNKGEFIIKVNSKDIFPEVAHLILNMWKQNVMTFNNEENILLAEFRDALNERKDRCGRNNGLTSAIDKEVKTCLHTMICWNAVKMKKKEKLFFSEP